jgi:hypothetical protein
MATVEEARLEMARRELARRREGKQPSAQVAPNVGEIAREGGVPLPQIRNVLDGLLFGFGGELESKITGTPLSQIEAEKAQFSEQYPGTRLPAELSGGLLAGGGGGAAVQAAGRAVPALGAAGNAIKAVTPNWAQWIGGGAAGGAVAGAGTSEPGDRVGGAVRGGVGGAVLGGGILGTGAVAKKAYETVIKPLGRQLWNTPPLAAKRLVDDYLAKAGMTRQQADALLQEYGDETMRLDLSPHLRDLAYDARSGNGPGRTIIDDALNARQAGQQNRLVLSAGQQLGAHADDARDFVTQITKAQSEQAAPLYASAHQQNIRTNPEFLKLWEGVPKSAIDKARDLARKEWHAGVIKTPGSPGVKTFDANGGLLSDGAESFDFDALPDVLRVDYVKRAYDDIIAAQLRAGEKQGARSDILIRNKILDYVDKQVPDFQKARGVWAGAEQLKSAAAFGQEVFKQDSDELADIVSRYGESEKQAFRYGVAQAIRDKVEATGSQTADAARKLSGSAKNRRIIKAAFGNDEEFERFMKQIEREGVYTESRYSITGNSKTDERGARRAERVGDAPEPSTAGVMAWLARHFGPQDPLRNPETNRLVSEWLTKGGYPEGLLNVPKSPGTGLMVVPPKGNSVQRRGLLQ